MSLSEIFRYLVSLSLLGSVLIIGILLIKFLFRHKLSANWHYSIWFVLILRLLIPFTPSSPFSVFNLLPQYQQTINLSQAFIKPAGSQTPAPPSNGAVSKEPTGIGSGGNTPGASPVAEKFSLNWATAAIVWLTLVVVLLLYIIVINGMLLFRYRKQKVCDDEYVAGVLAECQASLHLRAKVSVIYDDSLKSPTLFGFFRPKIIISPEIIALLPPEELRYIFLHELSHLKRRDLLVNTLVTLIQVIYWFNPLVLYALHQMKQDCEIACDSTALSAVKPGEYKKYGQTIIGLLQMLSEPHWAQGTIGFVNKFSKRRIMMISTFKKATITWTIAALALTLLVGCSSLTTPVNPSGSGQKQQENTTSSQPKDTAANGEQNNNAGTPAPSPSPAVSNSVVYKNTQYNFSFSLPESWKGYSIVTGKWEGNDIKSGKITETGPMISIRNPQWTSKNPMQDIPIIIFTLAQWNSLQKEVFHIGAAPIGPKELGRNSNYVFALPARYNFAFPTGYEEVEKVLANNPLQPDTH